MSWLEDIQSLEPSDLWDMPAWAIKSTLPQDEQGNVITGWQDPRVQKWAAEGMANAGTGMVAPIGQITGKIPTALAAPGRIAALAESDVPAYAAIGKMLQEAPGMAENAWNVAKEGLGRLGEKISGFAGEAAPVLEGAAASPGKWASTYDPVYSILGKRGISIPYIPQSIDEPLLIKSGAENLGSLSKMLFNPQSRIHDLSYATGLELPLWGERAKSIFRGGTPGTDMAGDLMLATIPGQEGVIPHETSHYLQDLLTAMYSKGKRPVYQEMLAGAPELGPAYREASEALWAKATDTPGNIGSQLRRAWPYGANDKAMAQELIAEMTYPKNLSDRFGTSLPLEKAEQLKEVAAKKWPALGEFWRKVPDYIPEGAYNVPQYNVGGVSSAAQLMNRWYPGMD